MPGSLHFTGTHVERAALMLAINHNCTCCFVYNRRMSLCSAHAMLLDEQFALNGLICQRRRAAELILQEFLIPKQD